MNKLKYIKASLLGLIVLGTVSCKKSFLELSPVSNANVDQVFKTKQDFELAMNNAFSTLYTVYGPKGALAFTGELMSDNTTVSTLAISGSFTIVDQQAFRDYTVGVNNSGVLNFWNDLYSAIYQTNIVVSKIGGADLDESYKKEVVAEMKFLRALYYFNMVRLWGGVPLVTTVVTGEQAYTMGRNTEAEVYAQIVDDLKDAAANLADPGSEALVGRATKGAAKTLLGKVYLTMGDKTTAAAVLKEVYDQYGKGAKYDLLPTFGALWGNSTANKNTKESIFEIQYKGGVGNPYSSFWPAFAPFENFAITKYGGGMNMVTDDLFNEYEIDDQRKDVSFYTGYTKNGAFVPVKFNKKWVDLTAPLDGGAAGTNPNQFASAWGIDIARNGNSVEIQFPGLTNRAVLIEWATNLGPSAVWRHLDVPANQPRYPAQGVPGIVPDPIAPGPQKFYRARVTPP